MTDDNFQKILEDISRISEVVNKFNSEELQKVVLKTILAQLDLKIPADVLSAPGIQTIQPEEASQGRKEKDRKRAKSRKFVTAAKDLNLNPDGRDSFRVFLEAHPVSNNNERNVASVYYLAVVLEIKSVNASHILACYLECGWKPPSDPENALQITSSSFNWLNTTDMQNVLLTPSGQNFVQNDLAKRSKTNG